jgi:hypothetical protein
MKKSFADRHPAAARYAAALKAKYDAADDIPADMTKSQMISIIFACDDRPQMLKSRMTLMKWSKGELWAQVKFQRRHCP